jgi:hypothetical protein
MIGGDLHIDGIGEPVITLDGVLDARGVSPDGDRDGGIADKSGIPVQYLRLMRHKHLPLLDEQRQHMAGQRPNQALPAAHPARHR